jgi:hypothetical protein
MNHHYHCRRHHHRHIEVYVPEFSEFTVCIFKEMMTAVSLSGYNVYQWFKGRIICAKVARDGICPTFREFSTGINLAY